MAQHDMKAGKDLDSFGNSMLGKLAKASKGRIMRAVSKRRRQRARRRIQDDLRDG